MIGRYASILVLAATASGGAAAQVLPVQQLERVDAGRADTGPLATSTRDMQEGLRAPLGFEHVYMAPGDSGSLMRISGALVAEFPRSQYNMSGSGPYPVVPAGTVFHIGMPSAWSWNGAASGGATPPAFNAIDRRVPPTGAPQAEDPDRPVDRSIWQSEVYRAFRVRELLLDAAVRPDVSEAQADLDG